MIHTFRQPLLVFRNTAVLISCLLMCAAVQAQSPSTTLKVPWLKRMVLDRIEISGYRTLGVQTYEVTGDREAWETLNLYGQGDKRFTDYGALDIFGRNVLGILNFQARVETGRFNDPQAQKFSIDYDRKPYEIHLGDVRGSLLNTNRFASFNKTLKGASATYRSGKVAVKGIYSEAKGSARTVSITGNNSAGPYFLQTGQIVRGSEEVQLDGQPMTIGIDYVINYELGSITFINRIIPPTSTIVVSFEAFGFNSDRGTVEGVSATYDTGKTGRIGLTAMRQRTGAGSQLTQRIELFQGAGAPSTPYFLQFEPLLSRPILVRLDGVLQTEGIDYRFDKQNPTIFYFNRFVPLTSTIEVVYTPAPTQTVDGDREVVGVDYRLPINSRGALSYSLAKGSLRNELTPLSGIAQGIEFNYGSKKYTFRGSIRDVPEEFVSVETRGFNRNERAIDLGVRHEKKNFRWDLSHLDSDVSIRRTLSTGQLVFTRSQNSTTRFGLSDSRRPGEPWSFEVGRLTSENTAGNTTLYTSRASTSRLLGNIQAHLTLEAQQGRGPILDGATSVIKDIALQSIRLGASYPSGRNLTFNTTLGLSNVRAGDDSGLGRDIVFSVSYDPSDRLSMNAGYTDSSSGALALLNGFQTGFGVGYNGNGYSGGVGNSGFVTGATDFRQLRFNTAYKVTDKINLTFVASENRYAGSVSSNTTTQAFDLGIDAILSSDTIAYLNLNQSDTRFLGSPQSSDATVVSFGISGRPLRRLNYDFRLNWLTSGGTSGIAQDDFGLDALLTYRLAERQTLLFLGRFGRTTGYLPQTDNQLELSYAYQIWKPVSLVGSYRFRDVRNQDKNPSGAYRANGFDLQLRFGF